MCTYISVTLPKAAKLEECRAAFERHNLRLDLMEVAGHPKGVLNFENYFFTCAQLCDCGTAIGSAYSAEAGNDDSHAQNLIERLRKRGWSEAKIQRRMLDFEANKEKSKRAQEALSEIYRESLKGWIGLFEHILKNGLATQIGITVNDYTGQINNPNFSIKRIVKNRKIVTAETLECLAPAVLLVIE